MKHYEIAGKTFEQKELVPMTIVQVLDLFEELGIEDGALATMTVNGLLKLLGKNLHKLGAILLTNDEIEGVEKENFLYNNLGISTMVQVVEDFFTLNAVEQLIGLLSSLTASPKQNKIA